MIALPGFMCGTACEEKHGVDVHVERQPPFLVADIAQILEGRLMRGIVDKDIDAAEFADRPVDDLPAVVRGPDVAVDQNDLASLSFDKCRHLLGIFVFVEVGDEEVRPLASKGDGDRASDAAVAAGDDGALSLKRSRALVTGLAVVWPRIHLRG